MACGTRFRTQRHTSRICRYGSIVCIAPLSAKLNANLHPDTWGAARLFVSSSLPFRFLTLIHSIISTPTFPPCPLHHHLFSPPSPPHCTPPSWMRTHFQPRRYTGLSCKSIDTHYNCEKNGRPNLKYLDYEWRIPGCSLKRFDPSVFLATMRNKVFMIVGDSYALNLHASMRCLIESVAVTQNFNGSLFKTGVPATGFRVPSHNATIIRIASAFLLYGEPDGERSVKSTWSVWLDKLDPEWEALLPFTDYVVMSAGYWYTSAREEKRHYLLSNSPNQLAWNPDQRTTMQTALSTIVTHFNRIKYRGLPMFLSFTSSHYGFELAGTEAARGAEYNCTDAWRPIGWRQVSHREWAVEDMRTRNAQVQVGKWA
ncbi:unnamed protein product [Closterium sp. Naga37s-1]|nr:unnamed protein product [Closterium sp. Naga37s-1]